MLRGLAYGNSPNLIATGTNDPYVYPLVACSPNADFLPVHQDICSTASISFSTNTTNGIASSWDWSFPGGTPSVSNIPNPVVSYDTPGAYSVTLTVSNASGSSTITRNNVVMVDYPKGQNAVPFTDDF